MSRIDELVGELCPDGVPFRELGELGELIRGRRFTKQDYVESGLGAIHYGEIYTDYGTATATNRSFIRSELAGSLRLAKPGDLVIAATGENVDDVCKAVAWVGDHEIAIHDDCYVFRHELEPKYVSYFFQSSGFQDQKTKFVSESKVVRISGANLAKIKIPVPPLEVQREIVKVLGRFTALETELKAELEARRNQRVGVGARLRPVGGATPDGWGRATLGTLVTQRREPVHVSSDDWYVNLGVRWYGEGAFAREPKPGSTIKARTLYRVRAGQFIYNRMFVTEGSFGLITPELANGVVSNEFPVFDVDQSRVLPDWLLITFHDPAIVRRAAAETTGGTKSRRRWNEDQFLAFEIDLPPLAVQREIVRVLRAFMDLESGLAAELAARRKQYAYYRDRLLTFQEAA